MSVARPPAPQTPFFGPCWDDGVAAVKRAWPLLFVATIVAMAAQVPSQFIMQFAQVTLVGPLSRGVGGNPDFETVASRLALPAIAVALLSVLLVQPATIGVMAAGIDAVRGRSARFSSVFLPFTSGRRYRTTVLLCLACMLAQLVAFAVIAVPLGAAAYLVVRAVDVDLDTAAYALTAKPITWWMGVALLAVAGLVLAIVLVPIQARLALIPLRAVDPDRQPDGVVAAWREMWAATEGRGWAIAGTVFLAGVLATASVLLCCVGILLIGYPFMIAMIGAVYDRCLPGPRELPPPPVVIGARPPLDSEPL